MAIRGRLFVNINGARMQAEKGASLSPGGPIRKAVMDGAGNFVGHEVEEVKHATAKFSIILTDKISVIDLQNLSDVTLVMEGDDGKQYLVRNASTEGEVDEKNGRAEVTMTGAPAEEI